MAWFKALFCILLALVVCVLIGFPQWAQGGNLDPELMSGRFSPNEEVVVTVWLEDQPGYRIARPIQERCKPEIEALGRQVQAMDRGQREDVRRLLEDIDAQQGTMLREIYRAIRSRIDVQQEEVKAAVEKLGGNVVKKLTIINGLSVVIPFEQVAELADVSGVAYVEWSKPSHPMLNVSTHAISADTFWAASETGGIFDFGLVDMGIKTTIQPFSGKTIYSSPESPGQGGTSDGSYPVDNHGTWVTGVAVGNPSNTDYRGVAYTCSTIFNAKPKNDEYAAFDWIIDKGDSLGDGADVINHSRGVHGGSTDYPEQAQFIDALVSTFSIAVTQSIGNLNATPPDTVPRADARSYNAIVVGAMNDRNTVSRTNDSLWVYSTRGPTSAGRKKPDLVAPGHQIITCDTSGTYSSPGPSGTSFAAPHVAGGVLLLKDAGVTDHLAIKAILINTAEDWGPADWDTSYGWGYMDLDAAYDHRSHYKVGGITAGSTKTYQGNVASGDKITLVWNRHVQYTSSGPGTVYDLSNLDLYLKTSSDQTIDSDTGTLDNVAQVESDGSYQNAKVVVEALSVDGVPSEPFALALPNNSFSLVPKRVAQRIPSRFLLAQNHPNPFNPTTTLRFELPHATKVNLVIYNTLGQVVRTLVDEQRARGAYQVRWDGKDVDGLDVASGIYFVRMKAGDFVGVRKMVMLR